MRITLTLAIAALTACGGPKMKVTPAAAGVKTVAFVGATMNREVYNIERGNPAKVNILAGVTREPDQAELEQIAAHGMLAYGKVLEGSVGWVVSDPIEVTGSEAYQATLTEAQAEKATEDSGKALKGLAKMAARMADGQWITPPDMGPHLIEPITGVYPMHKSSTLDAQQKAYGRLATDLGVDAVAMLQIDAAYAAKGVKISMGSKSIQRGKPNVAASLVIVNKEGEVVLKMPAPTFESYRIQGKGSWMVRDGTLDLRSKKGKGISVYTEVLDLQAADFEKKFAKKHTKALTK